MMTNWKNHRKFYQAFKTINRTLEGDISGLTKKERLNLERDREKLERALGGIKEMGNLPDILFVIDTNKEALAIQEASKLGVPIVAVVDSNSNPVGIDYAIPGNDDAMRAISMYCDLVVAAILDGLQVSLTQTGIDIGEAEEPQSETLVEAPVSHDANVDLKAPSAKETQSDDSSGESEPAPACQASEAVSDHAPETNEEADQTKPEANAN